VSTEASAKALKTRRALESALEVALTESRKPPPLSSMVKTKKKASSSKTVEVPPATTEDAPQTPAGG